MSWDAPTAGARRLSPTEAPASPEAPPVPFLPTQQARMLEPAGVDVLGEIDAIVPDTSQLVTASYLESAEGLAPNTLTSAPKWKKRKKSKLRRLMAAIATLAVLGALAAAAVFGYQAMNPPEDPEPSIPLRDRPETVFGRTGDLVDGINEGMPDQDLLDELLGDDGPGNDSVSDDRAPTRD